MSIATTPAERRALATALPPLRDDDRVAIEGFLDAFWADTGIATQTAAAYRRDLEGLARWRDGRDGGIAHADRTALFEHLAWRTRHGWSPRSNARLLSALRAFYADRQRRHGRADDPTALLDPPKLPRSLPKALSESQIDALLDAPDPGTPEGLRDRTMLELMYACGLRVSELTGLPANGVNLRQGALRVTGKGGRTRLVPLGEEAQHWLQRYLDEARTVLAEADVLRSLSGHRNAARWAVAGIERRLPLLPGSPEEVAVELPAPRRGEELLADYHSVGLTLREHPMALLRAQMTQRRILGLRALRERRHGSGVHVAGLVTQRQRPGTAKGTIFVTLEDEDGMINVIVWPTLALRRRRALLESRLLAVRGRWERVDGVEHLIAGDLEDLSGLLGGLSLPSRDFH